MIESMIDVVVVFPFVPVTATSCSASAGMPEEIRRRNRQRLPRFSHANPRHARRNVRRRALFAGDRHRAARDRVAHERISIHLRAVQRKKQCACLNFARVANDLPNFQSPAPLGGMSASTSCSRARSFILRSSETLSRDEFPLPFIGCAFRFGVAGVF